VRARQPDRTWDYFLGVLRRLVPDDGDSPGSPGDLDWSNLNRLVMRQHLCPIFRRAVPKEAVPSGILDQWRDFESITAVRNARGLSAAIRLTEILDASSVPLVFMRGIVLANTVYPDSSCRPMTDVDALIPFSFREQARTALEKKGLRTAAVLRSQFVYHIDGTVVEIHWSFLTPKRFRSVVDGDFFMRPRYRFDLSGGHLYRLSPEQELIGLILHAFLHHNLEDLMPLVDIALLSKKTSIHWEDVSVWVERAGLGCLFLFAFRFVDRLFGLNLEHAFRRFYPQDAPVQEAMFEAYLRRFRGSDGVRHRLLCKKNLLNFAETRCLKARQLLRFFAADEILDLLKRS
jgi:hypothetical protein